MTDPGEEWARTLRSQGRVDLVESRRWAAGFALPSVVFVAFGLVLAGVVQLDGGPPDLSTDGRVEVLLARLFGGFSTLLFGVALILTLRMIVAPRLAFSVTTDGVVLRAGWPPAPWNEMFAVEAVDLHRNRTVMLLLTSAEYDRIAARSRGGRLFSGVAQGITGGPALPLPTTARYDRDAMTDWLQSELEARRTAEPGTGATL
ncbi:hypothetical protein [Phycicoccus flavus]|uniref:PH domain-containing protein n=1 Tax=Phycicoccus flavus TaxID=2502783 RepID=A0A8T6R2T8_9MICO|nr:hypothetical protein [Phycicoccus flavus]NHA68297.1 hypothetical protein [Phycicoccus flavus]